MKEGRHSTILRKKDKHFVMKIFLLRLHNLDLQNSVLEVSGRINKPRLRKSFFPETTTVTATTCPALSISLIAGHCAAVINSQLHADLDNVRLAQRHPRRAYLEMGRSALHASLRGQGR